MREGKRNQNQNLGTGLSNGRFGGFGDGVGSAWLNKLVGNIYSAQVGGPWSAS